MTSRPSSQHHNRHFSIPVLPQQSPPSLPPTPKHNNPQLPLWHRLRDPSVLTCLVAPTLSPRLIAARRRSSSTTSSAAGSAPSSTSTSPLATPTEVPAAQGGAAADSYFPCCPAPRTGGDRLALRPGSSSSSSSSTGKTKDMPPREEVMWVGWWRGEFW